MMEKDEDVYYIERQDGGANDVVQLGTLSCIQSRFEEQLKVLDQHRVEIRKLLQGLQCGMDKIIQTRIQQQNIKGQQKNGNDQISRYYKQSKEVLRLLDEYILDDGQAREEFYKQTDTLNQHIRQRFSFTVPGNLDLYSIYTQKQTLQLHYSYNLETRRRNELCFGYADFFTIWLPLIYGVVVRIQLCATPVSTKHAIGNTLSLMDITPQSVVQEQIKYECSNMGVINKLIELQDDLFSFDAFGLSKSENTPDHPRQMINFSYVTTIKQHTKPSNNYFANTYVQFKQFKPSGIDVQQEDGEQQIKTLTDSTQNLYNSVVNRIDDAKTNIANTERNINQVYLQCREMALNE